MTHTSPTTFAVWAVLSTALGAFLLGHLWRFDRFKCLKWSNAPYSGAFKRIMTYTYLITIPLIMIYSFGFTYIKYKEGFIDIGGSIYPKPFNFWEDKYQKTIFPLYMTFAFAWSFEMVTHLEELCFWYFLITAGPSQPDWWHSRYFKLWVTGSLAAVIYLPVVTIMHRENPLACEARMFTAGSSGDLVLTLGFIPILFRFPNFINKVKAEGVDSAIIVRLRKFYELNVVRIIFRFLMQIPLFALGVDGLKPHSHELNESLFWTDLLSIVAALGCVFSSVCTLLIFFPRSYEAEYKAKEASHRRSLHSLSSRQSRVTHPAYSQYDSGGEEGDDANGAYRHNHNHFIPSSISKAATFNTREYADADYALGAEEELVKYERRMGTGLVKERWSSKLRERERRIARGTKKMGAGLQDVISRRLMRFPLAALPRQRHRRADPGSSANSLSLGVPSLSHEHDARDQRLGGGEAVEDRYTLTRRMTPNAARKRSGSTAVMSLEEGAGAGLERKGTYLLTDSPVLRAQRMLYEREREREREREAMRGASVDTLEAVYEAGVGAGAGYGVSASPVQMAETEFGYGATRGLGIGLGTTDKIPINEEENVDVDAFALDSPPPPSASVPSYSLATGLGLPLQASSPGPGPVSGPRPVKKSISISTTATAATTTTATRRALPTPPLAVVTDPLGAAPEYYPPEDPLLVTSQTHSQKNQNQNQNRTSNANADGNTFNLGLSMHPFASATPLPDRQQGAAAAAVAPAPAVSAAAPRTTYMRETSDGAAAISVVPRHDASHSDRLRGSRLPYGRAPAPAGSGAGLTRANVSRFNSATLSAPRASQLNPLVRTFTSPIDFLDRIQENGGSGTGSGEAGANGSRTNIGWAV